nr:unnamed protein product [Callosobruchus chinensis]
MNWGTSCVAQQTQNTKAVSHPELVNMLEVISGLEYSSVLHRAVEPFATKISKESLERLPTVLDLFREENMTKSYPKLIKSAKEIHIFISEDDISKIEKATPNQSQNPNWFIQRSGGITASRFKAVCKTNKTNPSLSLIKSICYPAKILFSTKATLWGISHENTAVKAYIKEMEKERHDSFIVNQVGVLVSKFWPQFAASPDRLVFCECCLGGCLEVKYPYLLHTNNISSIEEYLKMKTSCLVEEGDEIALKKNHSYDYQCQMQIFVTNLKYLIPELLGRHFTKKEGTAKVIQWCLCESVDDGRPMIKCDGDDCPTEWFHFECVGLEDTPSCPWYCCECKPNI